MPRDGSGVYSKPSGTTASPNTTIESAKYNSVIDDIVADLNDPRPVSSGGTEASNPADARTNLGLSKVSNSGIEATVPLFDDSDNTKEVEFDVSGITTGTTRTVAVPDASGTMVLADATQTLENKTLGAGTSLVTGNGTWYAAYGGTANAITLTTGTGLTSLTTGQAFRFRATAANTGAVTINVDGIGAVSAVTPRNSALPADYIRTGNGVMTTCWYNGTNIVVNREIERGAGAGGMFTRYEDGTQICSNNNITLNYSGTGSCEGTWSFQRDFNTASEMGISLTYRPEFQVVGPEDFADDATPITTDMAAIAYGDITTSGITIRGFRSTGNTDFQAGDKMYVSGIVHGFWY